MSVTSWINAALGRSLGIRIVRLRSLEALSAQLRLNAGASKTEEVLTAAVSAAREHLIAEITEARNRLTVEVSEARDRLVEEVLEVRNRLGEIQKIEAIARRIEKSTSIARLVARTPPHVLNRRILQLGALLSPCRAVGVAKIRVGRGEDGGYVMLDDFRDVADAVSFGIGPDDSWDRDMAARGIVVRQFDPEGAGNGVPHPNLRFAQMRLTPRHIDGGITLAAALDQCALDRPVVTKIDIEGDEWPVLEEAAPETLARVPQIACEFHGFGQIGDDRRFERMLRVLQNLDRQFAVVHVHANNHAPWNEMGGVTFPGILEVTFANRSRYAFEDTDELFPTSLDRPNDPSLPDLYLGRFQWRSPDA